MRSIGLALAALALGLVFAGPASAQQQPPPIKHVFVIVLENKNYEEIFGAQSKAPYLSKTLTAQGQLLPNYHAVTHLSLGNYLALISGQGSNPQTQADCLLFTDFLPGAAGPDGQSLGQGCVYPALVKTLANQLEDKGLSWKGYMEDMGNSPTDPKTCRHPQVNQLDNTQSAEVGDQYAARHNPFVYFHSIIDTPSCAANDVPLDRLPGDLASESTTASYSFITPNLCNDAHDEPCVDGKPGGLVSADAFLKEWVPRITSSPAYKQNGLLAVTFDEAESGPGEGDASACCNQPQFLNTPNNGGPVTGMGGGRIGTVLLSPCVQPGSVNQTPYNHFSFLRSVEDLFSLEHLGYAARSDLSAFGSDVYNRACAAAGGGGSSPEGDSGGDESSPRDTTGGGSGGQDGAPAGGVEAGAGAARPALAEPQPVAARTPAADAPLAVLAALVACAAAAGAVRRPSR